MKHLIALSGLAIAMVAHSPPALAQAPTPPLPQLTAQQLEDLHARIDPYRRETDARVAGGEITADEAARLVQWREWQIAQQIAGAPPPVASGRAPVQSDVPRDYDDARSRDDYGDDVRPPDYYGYDARPRDYYVYEPPPVYAPYYYRYPAPYYFGPRPYAYWGPSICAGGFGRHFGGRICF